MEKVTNQNGYGLIISQSQESWVQEISCFSTLFNSRVDGFLVSLAFDTQNIDHYNILFRKNIPLIFFDRVSDCSSCMSVIIDNFRAGYEATSHLIEQGCRRIIHIGGNLLRNVYSERLEGYKKALADNKIEPDNNLVFITDLSGPSAADVVRKVLKMKILPDGIFTANDTSAVAVIIELQKQGIKIPEEIAVIGFNNEPVSKVVKPNLSTIDYPALEIGEFAATSLINMLRGKQSDNLNTIVLKHNLIVRESSLKKGAR
jgi:LacI family transcriptional regulator